MDTLADDGSVSLLAVKKDRGGCVTIDACCWLLMLLLADATRANSTQQEGSACRCVSLFGSKGSVKLLLLENQQLPLAIFC